MNTLSFKYSLRLQNTNVRKLRNYLLESLKQILLLLLLLLLLPILPLPSNQPLDSSEDQVAKRLCDGAKRSLMLKLAVSIKYFAVNGDQNTGRRF